MEINWFTVIAQVINFFILVWLLKRFLYKPILKAIDERESKIAAQLQDAELKKAEALKEQQDYLQKNSTFDQEKKDRMEKVVSEMTKERQKLLDQARSDAEALTRQLDNNRKEQEHNQQLELNRKIKEEIFAVSRKMLGDLASVNLDEQLTQVFIKRIKSLKEIELNELKAAFETSSDPLLVRSAFKLSEKQQQALKDTLVEVLDSDINLKYEESPALIGGIELSSHEYKLAWSISEYLNAFEKTISRSTQKKIVPPVEEN